MIEIIDLLKPKNGGSFKLIEDIDIAVNGYSSLADCVAHMATTAMIEAINAALSGKQDKLTTEQLAACNSGITTELVTQIGTNTSAIAGKADTSDLTVLSAVVATKANSSDVTTSVNNLQGQIDAIAQTSGTGTADTEIAQARVDVDGTTYLSLKSRIDHDVTTINGDISGVNDKTNEIYDKLIVSESVNQFQQITAAQYEAGYVENGSVVSDNDYRHTDYIPIEGGVEYVLGFVPAYGSANYPWFMCSSCYELYDKDKTLIKNITTSDTEKNGHFVSPYSARYIRFNVKTSTGIDRNQVNSRTMLVKGVDLPENYSGYSATVYPSSAIRALSDSVQALQTSVEDIEEEITFVSPNLYDASLQTPETISPHYYVNGVPYSETIYDSSFNCTALIPVEPNTTYTVALVPTIHDYSKPWGGANSGGFCYDENGDYISGSGFKALC